MNRLPTLILLAAVTGAMAAPSDGVQLSRRLPHRAPDLFAVYVLSQSFRLHLQAMGERRNLAHLSPAFRKALPELIAARTAEIETLGPIVELLKTTRWQQEAPAMLDRLPQARRDWLAWLAETETGGIFDRWRSEAASLDPETRDSVYQLIKDEAAQLEPPRIPLRRPILMGLVIAMGVAILEWRRRKYGTRPAGSKDSEQRTARAGPPPRAIAGLDSAVLAALKPRYVEIVQIGLGAWGLVLRARDRHLNRDVAIKVPHSAALARPDAFRRFLREAQSLASLSHPAIVRIYDVHTTEPVYHTMELVEGRGLDELLTTKGRFEEQEALELMAPIAGALAACHAAGVVHRDVKPANILVDRTGRSFLTDFGLAFLEGGTRLTQTNQILGTPAYIAPEVLEGEAPTARCDVHAWGLVLYDLLKGGPDHDSRKLAARLTEDLPRLDCKRSGLMDLVMDCVSRKPDLRPADGGVLVARLSAIHGASSDPQVRLAAFARQLEALQVTQLHGLKNRTARTGHLEPADRAEIETIWAHLRQLQVPPGVDAKVASRVQALAASMEPADPAAIARAHQEVEAILEALSLPLRKLVSQVVAQYGAKARLTVDLPPPPLYLVDRSQAESDLQLIIGNLIDNGLEADATSVEVVLGTGRPVNSAATVQVSNDGRQFPEALRTRAFREPISENGPGRGTGLITVQRFARAHGWSISLEPGEPTTFRLTLPVG